MLVARSSAAARHAGVAYRSFANADRMAEFVEADDSGSSVQRALIDLQTPGLDIDDVAGRLRQLVPGCTIIAYAQHVKTDLLEAARAADIDRVLTRGQFDQQVPQLVAGK